MAAVLHAEGAIAVATSGTVLTGTWPAGYTPTADDIAVFVVGNSLQAAGVTISTPSGWTEHTGSPQEQTNGKAACFWKRLAGGESAPQTTVSSTNTSSFSTQGVIYIIRGARTTGNPFDALAQAMGTSTSPNPPSITSTGAGLIIGFVYVDDDNTFTAAWPPTGYTAGTHLTTTTGGDSAFNCYRKTTTGETSDPAAITMSASDPWMFYVFAFADASSSTPISGSDASAAGSDSASLTGAIPGTDTDGTATESGSPDFPAPVSDASGAGLDLSSLLAALRGYESPYLEGTYTLQNTGQSGTDGTAITAGSGGNTGGANGDFFDTVSKGADGIAEFSNLQGGISIRVATRTVATAVFFGWAGSLPDRDDEAGSFEAFFEALPGSATSFFRIRDAGGTAIAAIGISSTTGVIRVVDSTSGTTTLGTVNLIGRWLRFEYHFSGPTGQMVMRIFDVATGAFIEEASVALTDTDHAGQTQWGLMTAAANFPTATTAWFFRNFKAQNSGMSAETGSWSSPISASDASGAGADDSSLSAQEPASDASGAGADLGAILAALVGTDAQGASPDSAVLAALLAVADLNSTTTEATGQTASIPASDTEGSTTETGSLLAPGTPTGTDASGATTESGGLAAAIPGSQAGSGTDSGSVSGSIPGTDTQGASTENTAIQTVIAGADQSGTASEVAALIAQALASDSSVSASQIAALVAALPGSDADGPVTEVGVVQVGTQSKSGSDDSGGSIEQGNVSALLLGLDSSFVAVENAALLLPPGALKIIAVGLRYASAVRAGEARIEAIAGMKIVTAREAGERYVDADQVAERKVTVVG